MVTEKLVKQMEEDKNKIKNDAPKFGGVSDFFDDYVELQPS